MNRSTPRISTALAVRVCQTDKGEDKEDVTVFMDDPELRPDCKYIYGERKKGV